MFCRRDRFAIWLSCRFKDILKEYVCSMGLLGFASLFILSDVKGCNDPPIYSGMIRFFSRDFVRVFCKVLKVLLRRYIVVKCRLCGLDLVFSISLVIAGLVKPVHKCSRLSSKMKRMTFSSTVPPHFPLQLQQVSSGFFFASLELF